mmetsp:Transcript_3586/g.9008  ORF Transcript_3586/g.9008 Transcript_3586/m.9008 type:complete len:233 (+) Transcript_3586:4170-4868(+)
MDPHAAINWSSAPPQIRAGVTTACAENRLHQGKMHACRTATGVQLLSLSNSRMSTRDCLSTPSQLILQLDVGIHGLSGSIKRKGRCIWLSLGNSGSKSIALFLWWLGLFRFLQWFTQPPRWRLKGCTACGRIASCWGWHRPAPCCRWHIGCDILSLMRYITHNWHLPCPCCWCLCSVLSSYSPIGPTRRSRRRTLDAVLQNHLAPCMGSIHFRLGHVCGLCHLHRHRLRPLR